MGTDIGIPRVFPRPEPCSATTHSISIFWFADNPATFGGASTIFEMRGCGEGRSFDDFPIQRVTLEDAIIKGKEILELMQDEYNGTVFPQILDTVIIPDICRLTLLDGVKP
jgi:hypothetical protein